MLRRRCLLGALVFILTAVFGGLPLRAAEQSPSNGSSPRPPAGMNDFAAAGQGDGPYVQSTVDADVDDREGRYATDRVMQSAGSGTSEDQDQHLGADSAGRGSSGASGESSLSSANADIRACAPGHSTCEEDSSRADASASQTGTEAGPDDARDKNDEGRGSKGDGCSQHNSGTTLVAVNVAILSCNG